MMRKIKGQGALEYLLLIGGAVLIAVIVIALLVGMGGQSREAAQDQATKAQQSLDQPQAATIISIVPIDNCTTSDGNVIVNWSKVGEGGVYTLRVFDYSGTQIGQEYDISDKTASFTINVNHTGKNCQDSYWGQIITTKNDQNVSSARMKWNWP